MKKYTIQVQEAENGDAIIQFPDEVIAEVGWQEGDTINWEPTNTGGYILSKIEKKETEWVLVECVNTFRTRYMCEVPKGKKEYALDTVTMEEAKDFSSEHIGEQIISHRIVTEEEALQLFDKDNDYLKNWSRKQKIKSGFTRISDLDKKWQ